MKKASGIFVLFLALTACQQPSSLADIEPGENKQEETPTTKNMQTAFAGESEANRKYTAFAKIADDQGYPQVAKLFRAAATAEGIHASNHMKVLGMLKSTEQNLKDSVEGEQYEFSTMYPNFIKTAKDAGQMEAAKSMEWAFEVEQLHNQMFRAALAKIENGENPSKVSYWVCKVCGNTIAGTPPQVCNICGTSNSFFEVK